MGNKLCRLCGNKIPKDRIKRQSKFCKNSCRISHHKIKVQKANPDRMIGNGLNSRNAAGAASELSAASDLILRGFEVFKSLVPSSSCDLIAMRGKKCVRVEVTTGTYSYLKDSTKIFYRKKDLEKCDLLAIVFHDKVLYIPELDAE